MEKFTFFWKGQSPFSQFHPSVFTGLPLFPQGEEGQGPPPPEERVTFLHCEMWMMVNKALLFKDFHTAEKILNTQEPIKCKMLGRKVRNFDLELWTSENRRIVREGNRLKFSQNPALLSKLLATAGSTLVEASPTDRIYGIGLTENDPRAQKRSTWRGANLLGQVLTELREEFIKKEETK